MSAHLIAIRLRCDENCARLRTHRLRSTRNETLGEFCHDHALVALERELQYADNLTAERVAEIMALTRRTCCR